MNTRQQDIITLLEKRGEITVKDLAAHLGVSEMTVHRDLNYLEEHSYLYKKRGAAVFVECSDREKSVFYADEKYRIGKKAAELIKPGQSVIFDNSTTALECAKHLDLSMGLTFYTTSLQASLLLSKFKNSVLYCSGGYFFPHSMGFVGTQAEEFISSVHADVCIIGTSGISSEHGLTAPYPMHTRLQQKIIGAAKKRILVADHSKFDKTAMEKITDLSDIDVCVTDGGISLEQLERYKRHFEIVLA